MHRVTAWVHMVAAWSPYEVVRDGILWAEAGTRGGAAESRPVLGHVARQAAGVRRSEVYLSAGKGAILPGKGDRYCRYARAFSFSVNPNPLRAGFRSRRSTVRFGTQGFSFFLTEARARSSHRKTGCTTAAPV